MPSAAVKNIDATSPMFDEIMYLVGESILPC
jgi:hypothetical protein